MGILTAAAVYLYAMRPPAKIESKAVDFSGTSDSFMAKVKEDATVWENKVVSLMGKITSKDDKGITLSNQIYCQFRDDVDSSLLNVGSEITLKGRVIGYDDLLEELKLDQCIIQ
ncbi:hypothetical protein RQM59_09535 [Flavobacteriaceae bacterium S356]|uniref:tRNA_anti-like n=1 Tax=Asprobacillus argus TaxID=3076534 RepID=A0ABU3LGA2_9FLAO|nr:hypothetical protein [Flavobacteriaceae bacterium S356]